MDDPQVRITERIRSSRVWAVVSILLGTGQVFAATLALILWLRTGESYLTIGSMLFAVLLLVVSRLLFRGGDETGNVSKIP